MRVVPLACACLIVTAATHLAPSQAQTPSVWATEVVAGVPDTVAHLRADRDGERVGIMYKQQSTGKAGFAIRNADGVWASKSTDVTGAAAARDVAALVHVNGQTWIASLYEEAAQDQFEVWRSSNDGATWTEVAGFNTDDAQSFQNMDLALLGSRLGMVYEGIGSGAVGHDFVFSDDYGSTWSTPRGISCNQGGPATPCTTTAASCTDLKAGVLPHWAGSPPYTGFICAGGGGIGNTVYLTSPDGVFWDTVIGKPRPDPQGTQTDLARCVPESGAVVGGAYVRCSWFEGCTGSYSQTMVAMNEHGDGDAIVVHRNTSPTSSYCLYGGNQALYQWNNGCPNPPTCSAHDEGISENSATWRSPTILTDPCTSGPGSLSVDAGGGHTVIAERCVSGATKVHVTTIRPLGSPLTDISVGTTSTLAEVLATTTHFFVFYTDSTQGGRLEALVAEIPPPGTIAGVGACAGCTITVTDLKGFDVDPLGSVIITREGGSTTPTRIKTYAALSMEPLGVLDSSCNRIDGVAAAHHQVTYTDCTANSGQTNELRIRSHGLGPPPVPAGCASACVGDFTTNVQVPPNLMELGRISDNTWDFTTANPELFSGADNAVVVLSWAFSTTDGYVGVYTVINVGGGYALANDDETEHPTGFVLFDHTPAHQVDQICSWHNSPNLLSAAGQNSPSAVYTIRAGRGTAGGGVDDTSVQVLPLWSSNTFGEAIATGCGGERVMFATERGLIGVLQAHGVGPNNEGRGEPLWTRDLGITHGIPKRGVAMSGDGQFAAYVTNRDLRILDAGNGTILANFTIPNGSFYGMDMDWTAQSIWVATTQEMTRYVIFPVTTEDPVACVADECLGEPDPNDRDRDGIPDESNGNNGRLDGSLFGTGGQGIFGSAAEGMGDALGMGPTIGGLFLATVVTAFAGIMAARKDNRLGYIVGATTFALCFIIGWIPVEVVVILILGLAAKLVTRHKGIFT